MAELFPRREKQALLTLPEWRQRVRGTGLTPGGAEAVYRTLGPAKSVRLAEILKKFQPATRAFIASRMRRQLQPI